MHRDGLPNRSAAYLYTVWNPQKRHFVESQGAGEGPSRGDNMVPGVLPGWSFTDRLCLHFFTEERALGYRGAEGGQLVT